METRTLEMHRPPVFAASYFAEVVSVEDPLNQARVQVRLLNFDGVMDQDAPLWARVAMPFAGPGRGAFLLPDVGDSVLVSFVDGDTRAPVVLGGLWHGNAAPPETLPGDRVDRWTMTGKAGTRIAIIEENTGEATISLTTPGGVGATLKQTAGGEIELEAGGATVTVDSAGVRVQTPGSVDIQASEVKVTAGQVTVNAMMTTVAGLLKCDVLQSSVVISSMYTPGAGNVW